LLQLAQCERKSKQCLRTGLFGCGGERSDTNQNHAQQILIAAKVAR
jgi:hypothetical protein